MTDEDDNQSIAEEVGAESRTIWWNGEQFQAKRLGLRVPPSIHRRLRLAAVDTDRTINDIVVGLLDEHLPHYEVKTKE